MGWVTIYISGRPGFKEDVLHHLEKSDIVFMPGSTEGEKDLSLFWVDEKTSLREFKKAIGSKTVFKYRLQFRSHIEELKRSSDNQLLTSREKDMIREMTDWQRLHNHNPERIL